MKDGYLIKKNKQNMIKGYREMAIINLELANEGLFADNEAQYYYEKNTEREESDDKKRRHILR